MTPQVFAAATGTVIGATGLLGMVSAFRKETFEKREDLIFDSGYGKIAGVIPTSTAFNWVRVAIGASGLLCARSEESAVVYNRTVAIAYGGLALMGLVPKANTVFGLLPIFGGNILLHSGTAVAEILLEEQKFLDQAKNVLPFRRVKRGGSESRSAT